MDLLTCIKECSDEETNCYIKESLKELNNNSEKKILGFVDIQEMQPLHKGFISSASRIKYSNMSMESYSMKTEDYFYEFAHFVKKNNVKSKGQLVGLIEPFINYYFGLPKYKNDVRSNLLNNLAWNNSTTDEEYFSRLENNEIGDFKDKGVALCSERAALAQNLLSMYEIESYYCIGCINNNGMEEAHCYNIAKAKDKYVLLDYSIPSPMFVNGKLLSYMPFQGDLELTDIENMTNNGITKSFNSYEWVKNDKGFNKVILNKRRTYAIGKLYIEDEKDITHSI